MSDRESKQVKVWDLGVRGFHWSVALLVPLAFVFADDDETITLHTRLGLVVLGLVVFRIVWGFVGPAPARFGTFVRSPRAVLAYGRDYLRGRPARHLSHNPLGAVMVVALLGVLLATTVTGLLVYLGPEWSGPLALGRGLAHDLKELHEGLAEALPWMVVLHVVGVLISSRLERQNLIGGMITGNKALVEAPPVRRHPVVHWGAFLLAVSLGVASVLGVSLLLPGRAEAAETPQSLLERYRAQARREPGFTGFDAARGEVLYRREFSTTSRANSCAGCHTADPRRPGRSPAGKNIEPLAPSAAPDRFTDPRHADKWFDRNCKQLIGRVCTATERGDLLTWLLTFQGGAR